MFDTIAFADYSGSEDPALQRKKIALAVISRPQRGRYGQPAVSTGMTREDLRRRVDTLLQEEAAKGRRVLFGFDHQYAFPVRFSAAIANALGEVHSWRFQRELLADGRTGIPVAAVQEKTGDMARAWAAQFNSWARGQWGCNIFWGPNFSSQVCDPKFSFAQHGLDPLRRVEQRTHTGGMKSIFKIGGNGTVGLQSLSGIPHLHRLLESARDRYRVHVWPFDGFECHAEAHVLAEIYPTIQNRGVRGDKEDAAQAVLWAAQFDESDALEGYFRPKLTPDVERDAMTEGWVLGVT